MQNGGSSPLPGLQEPWRICSLPFTERCKSGKTGKRQSPGQGAGVTGQTLVLPQVFTSAVLQSPLAVRYALPTGAGTLPGYGCRRQV